MTPLIPPTFPSRKRSPLPQDLAGTSPVQALAQSLSPRSPSYPRSIIQPRSPSSLRRTLVQRIIHQTLQYLPIPQSITLTSPVRTRQRQTQQVPPLITSLTTVPRIRLLPARPHIMAPLYQAQTCTRILPGLAWARVTSVPTSRVKVTRGRPLRMAWGTARSAWHRTCTSTRHRLISRWLHLAGLIQRPPPPQVTSQDRQLLYQTQCRDDFQWIVANAE